MIAARRLWLAFAVVSVVVLCAVGGLSYLALDLEARAQRQERLRLALWRLDTHVNPVIYRLAALDYSHYVPAFAPSRLNGLDGRPIESPLVLQPSPILTRPWPIWVRLHFQAPLAGGGISSPQIPSARLRWVGRQVKLPPSAGLTKLLGQLRRSLTPQVRLRMATAALAQSPVPSGPKVATPSAPRRRVARARGPGPRQPPGQDWSLRNDNQLDAQQQFIPVNPSEPLGNLDLNWFDRRPGSKGGAARVPIKLTPVRAAWLPRPSAKDPTLLLYRVAEVSGRRTLQGALIDWRTLRAELVGKVGDLIAQLSLRPSDGAASPPSSDAPARMSSLPVELIPLGRIVSATVLSPAWTALLIAVLSTVLALAAAAWALRRVVELGQRRMDLVNAVSHELRTPLTGLRMYLDLLADDLVEDPERRKEILGTLQGQALRLSDLVRDVLDYARFERRSFVAAREEIAFTALFDDLVKLATERCRTAGLALEVANAVPQELTVSTDATAVRQIVVNLVDNASKYAAGADDPRVSLRARVEGAAFIVEVADHGPGIPVEARGRIFEPFYRAGREMTREQPGVGLGLALAQRFARAIGARLQLVGEVRADRTVEAVFELRLPRA